MWLRGQPGLCNEFSIILTYREGCPHFPLFLVFRMSAHHHALGRPTLQTANLLPSRGTFVSLTFGISSLIAVGTFQLWGFTSVDSTNSSLKMFGERFACRFHILKTKITAMYSVLVRECSRVTERMDVCMCVLYVRMYMHARACTHTHRNVLK